MTAAGEVLAHAPNAPTAVQDRAAAFLADLRVAATRHGITRGDLALVCSPVAIAVDAAGMAVLREKRQAERSAPPVCVGCGVRLISLDDDRTPASERTRWADDSRFDGPDSTAQDCDRTESGVHEPVGQRVSA